MAKLFRPVSAIVPIALATIMLGAPPGQSAEPARTAAQNVSEWRDAVARARREQSTLPPTGDVHESIRRLVEIDEVARQYLWLADDMRLSEAERLNASRSIGEQLHEVDGENTRRLLPLIPKEGWFSLRRYGAQTAHGAWLIVQHSPDRDLRARVLKAMERLVRRADADPHDYALLFDRVRTGAGQPQRFGTQATCRVAADAVRTLAPLERPQEVDRLRASIGWGVSLAETKGDLQIGRPC
ncbi:MAG: hypothetical protein QOH04_998 [Sphingomonadales bacterium]|jgi:hypothetical protein|nr:hypothetical protein [Sphingomonadales bacterium]MEA3035239.1 hypothetical protein [Sphingomonadales bacterium]